MIILAIETSCDETAIAVVETNGDLKRPLARPNPPAGGEGGEFKILSNIVSSQVKVHAPFWGVVPNLAKREHQRNLVPLLISALKEAKLLNPKFKTNSIRQLADKILNSILVREQELLEQFKKSVIPLKPPRIDLIAVTHGPGLEPALWVGVNFAKALGFLWKKPIIGINHLEGHIVANWLKLRQLADKNQKLRVHFPALCLVVSGGHTQLVLMKDFGKYKTIGETRDDAAGEAFDKVARMLGLGYPGGPVIAVEAAKIPNPKSQIPNKFKIKKSKIKIDVKLPRPMINSKDYDFSFSGLKTAVLYLIKDLERKGYSLKEFRVAVAAEFQQAVIDVLISKTLKAAENYKVKSVLLGGGVSANKNLRQQMKKAVKEKLPKVIYHEPDLKFTTDNAAMIAAAARFHLKEKKNWSEMEAEANLRFG